MRSQDVRVAVDAWEAMFRAQSGLLREFESDDVWEPLSLREYDVLFALRGFEGHRARIGDLADAVLVVQPSLSRLVDRLVAAGCVAKEPVPGDRRGVAVRLTDHGAALQRRIGARHAAAVAARMTAALDAEQLVMLRALCDTLRQAAGPRS